MTIRLGAGYLVWDWRRSSHKGWLFFWSPNGTPWHPKAVCLIGRKKCCVICEDGAHES